MNKREKLNIPFASDQELDVVHMRWARRLELPFDPRAAAARDLLEGLRAWESWGMLGWHDIRQRYRRSTLGPFWITITMGATIGPIGLIFGVLLGQNVTKFMPFVASGMIIWALLSTLLTDGCLVFTSSEQIIRQIKLPYSLHVFRMVWRTLIVFAHNIWVYVATIVIFAAWPGFNVLWAIPGLFLIVINGVWVSLLLALACARFRDIPLIVVSVLNLLYLATPIVWMPESLRGHHTFIYELNPLYHLLELVRAPLLGLAPDPINWEVGVGMAAVGWAVTFVIFARYRWRIPYWV